MDIFINGKQGAGKTRAAEAIVAELERVHKNDAHLYAFYPSDIKTVALLREELRMARTRSVIFDGCILNGADLLIAVQGVKEYREQVNADILAIYVQQAEVTTAKDVAENMSQLLTQDVVDVTKYPQFKKDLEDFYSGAPSNASLGLGLLPSPVAEYAERLQNGSLTRYAVDLGKDDGTAATLVQGDVTLVEARNIYAFEGALRLGKGTREPVSMLFELAQIVPVSNLHVAVDKMNTHYFATGTFEKRAFNVKNVRRANAEETLTYLNAKLKYLSTNEAN